jgi:hypothetical protein
VGAAINIDLVIPIGALLIVESGIWNSHVKLAKTKTAKQLLKIKITRLCNPVLNKYFLRKKNAKVFLGLLPLTFFALFSDM